MPTNVYYNNYEYAPEQHLYEDLIIESIQIYGADCKYITRDLNEVDPLYTEAPAASYNNAYDIELYLKSIDGFTGDGIFLSKFGLEIRDEAIFTVAKRRFEKQIMTADPTRNVPKEGDLIYWPLNKKTFQIKFVDFRPFFYQHGKLPVYDLITELWEYSGEVVNTGIDDIDRIQDQYSTDVLPYTLLTEDGEYIYTENGQYIVQEVYSIDDISDSIGEWIDDTVTDDDIIDWSEMNPFCEAQEYNRDTLNRAGIEFFSFSKQGYDKWKNMDLYISGGIENEIDIT